MYDTCQLMVKYVNQRDRRKAGAGFILLIINHVNDNPLLIDNNNLIFGHSVRLPCTFILRSAFRLPEKKDKYWR